MFTVWNAALFSSRFEICFFFRSFSNLPELLFLLIGEATPYLLFLRYCIKKQSRAYSPLIIFPLPFFFPSFQAFFLHSLLSISQQSSILPSNSSCSGRERIFRKPAFSYARMALGLLLWGSRRRIPTALFSFR